MVQKCLVVLSGGHTTFEKSYLSRNLKYNFIKFLCTVSIIENGRPHGIVPLLWLRSVVWPSGIVMTTSCIRVTSWLLSWVSDACPSRLTWLFCWAKGFSGLSLGRRPMTLSPRGHNHLQSFHRGFPSGGSSVSGLFPSLLNIFRSSLRWGFLGCCLFRVQVGGLV